MAAVRGQIQHRDRARQILDFSGMRFERSITPTDFDMVLHFRGPRDRFNDRREKMFLVEVKYREAQMPSGQTEAFVAAIDSWTAAGTDAYGLVVWHDVDDTSQDVLVHETIVDRIYSRGKWRQLSQTKQLRLIDAVNLIRSGIDPYWGGYGEQVDLIPAPGLEDFDESLVDSSLFPNGL